MAENIVQSALSKVRQTANQILRPVQQATQDTRGFVQQGRFTPIRGAGELLNQAFPGATTRIQQAVTGQPMQLRDIRTGQVQTVTKPKLFDLGQQLQGFGEVLSPPDIGLQTKQTLTPIIGAERAGQIGYGLQGATSYAPSIFGRTERAAALATLSAPTTESERAALSIGQELPFIVGSGAFGGLRGVLSRGVQGTALGVGMQGVANVATGQDFFKDMGKAATEGALSSWKLALTNALTDKIASKFARLRPLTTQGLETGGRVLKSAIAMGSPQARQIFANTTKRLFQRALLESPIENTVFTTINQMTGQDKRTFIQAWLEDLAGTTAGNLLFAGLVTGKRGVVDFNRDVIDQASQAFTRTTRRLFTDPEFRKGFIRIPEVPGQKGLFDTEAQQVKVAPAEGVTPPVTPAQVTPPAVIAPEPVIGKPPAISPEVPPEVAKVVSKPKVQAKLTIQPKNIDKVIQEGNAQIGRFVEPEKPMRQVLSDSYTMFVDRYNPIVKQAQKAKAFLTKEGAVLRPEFDPEYLVRRLTGAGGIADARFNQELKPIFDQIDTAGISKIDMDTYLANKRIAGFQKAGRTIYGADPEKAGRIVAALEQKYGQKIKDIANNFYAYQNVGLKELVDSGFLSKDAENILKQANPDYAPLYRVMDQMDEYLGVPSNKTMQGISPIQKIKGSTRLIESPTESIIANTFKQRAAIEKNNVAKAIVGLQNITDVGITPLRTAQNVLERISLYKFAKDIKPLQDSTERLIRSNQRQVRSLQTEINRLEKKGLDIALKGTFEKPETLVSGVKTTTIPEKVRFGKGELQDVVIGGTPQRVIIEDLYATTKNRGEQSTKNFINALIELPDKAIQNLKKRVATKENKLGPLLDDLQSLRNEYEAYKTVRRQTIAEAQLLKDAEAKGKSTISVWNNGVKEIYEVPKEIAETAKSLNEDNVNTFLQILSYPASILRQGATGRNIEFMIPNVVRDQLDAAITSKYGYVPFVDFTRGFWEVLKNDLNTKFGLSLDDTVYQSWANSGAKIDLGQFSGKKSIQQYFDEKTAKRNLMDWVSTGLDVLGRYSEQPTRIGLYKKALDRTGNPLLAMMESRDATIDFARMGTKMKTANSVIPFLNVGVQGFDKLVRAVKNDPIKIAWNMTKYAAIPAGTITAYNLLNHKEEYAEIPQYVKDSNFVLVKGRNSKGTVDYITIPKGNIVPLVANPIESFMGYLANVDTQSFGELATKLLTQTLPIVGDAGNIKESAIKTVGGLIPQAIKPITENLLNVSFYKYNETKEEAKKIVPDYLKKKPAYQQAYEWTPNLYKSIGAVLNVSPLQVQNLMEGYLAGYTKLPSQIVDALVKLSRGESITPRETPILRRFINETLPVKEEKPVYEPPTPSLMERITGKAGATGQLPEETNVDVIKQKLDFDPQRATANEISTYYLRDLNLNQTGYQKNIEDKKFYSRLSSLENRESLSADQKRSAIDLMLQKNNVSRADYDYYKLAKDLETNENKTLYVQEQIGNIVRQGGGPQQIYDFLANNQLSVRGNKIVTSGVLTNLVDAGIITDNQSDQLKKLEVTGSASNPNITAKAPKRQKLRARKPRVGAVKAVRLKQVKLPKAKAIKLTPIKPVRFARLKQPKTSRRAKLQTIRVRS